MDIEDDIYGEDIYGGSSFANAEIVPAGLNDKVSGTTRSDKSAEILELEGQLEDKDNRIADLEDQLHTAVTALEEWRGAAREGTGVDSKTTSDPAALAVELRRLRSAVEKQQQQAPPEDLTTIKQREMALQMQLAERNLENIELRRQAHAAQQCADPRIAQVRQLLLDPAVEKEFERMRTELETKAKEVKGLQEELQAVQFSQDSKAGRMLMAKCRALQDENEEMGKELAEGKVHALERQVALSKTYVEDMRARYLELEDHAHSLDAESEDLHQQVFMLKRQLREAEVRSTGPSRDRERPLRLMQSGPKYNGGGFGAGGHGLPGPPGGGPSQHGLGKYEMSPPDVDRKRAGMRDGGMDGYSGGKRLR